MNLFDLYNDDFDNEFWLLQRAGDWPGLARLIEPYSAPFLIDPASTQHHTGLKNHPLGAVYRKLSNSGLMNAVTLGDALHFCLRNTPLHTAPTARLVLLTALNATHYLVGTQQLAGDLVLTACVDVADRDLRDRIETAHHEHHLDRPAYRAIKALRPLELFHLWLWRHDLTHRNRDGRYTRWALSNREIALVLGVQAKGASLDDQDARAEAAVRQARRRAGATFVTKYREFGGEL